MTTNLIKLLHLNIYKCPILLASPQGANVKKPGRYICRDILPNKSKSLSFLKPFALRRNGEIRPRAEFAKDWQDTLKFISRRKYCRLHQKLQKKTKILN